MHEGYTIKGHVGKGSQGSVYRAIRIDDGQPFVVKVISIKQDENLNSVQTELDILQRVKGKPHLAQMVDSSHDELLNKRYIFLVDAGQPLSTLIKQHKSGLPEAFSHDLFRQLVSAVATLHGLGICHRDIKPDNVMVKPDASFTCGYQLTLIDFNVAKEFSSSNLIEGATGVKAWSAPETRSELRYDEKCDSFSLGCILAYMLTGAKPDSSKTADLEGGLHPEAQQLINKLKEPNP